MSILKAEISYEIMKLLEQHCCKDPNGYALYEKGWNDARIARKLKVGVGSVAHRRKQMFGHLRDATPGAGRPPMEKSQSFARLEASVFQILENQTRINRLIEHLYARLGEPMPIESGAVNGHDTRAAV